MTSLMINNQVSRGQESNDLYKYNKLYINDYIIKKSYLPKLSSLLKPCAMGITLFYSGSAVFAGETVNYQNGDPLTSISISGGPSLGNSVAPSNGSHDNNTINVLSGSGIVGVIGAYSSVENQNNNIVNITSGISANYVLGGASNSGNIVSNTVNIGSTAVVAAASGGWSTSSLIQNNIVNLKDDAKVSLVYGGGGWGTGVYSAIGNTVNVYDRVQIAEVFGSKTASGEASGNNVIINDQAIISNIVTGAMSKSGLLKNNSVTINGQAKITNYVFGVMGDSNSTSDMLENNVTINGGTIGKDVVGAYSQNAVSGSVIKNRVTVKDGIIKGSVTGGSSKNGLASENIVEIHGGTIGTATGGSIIGGYSVGNLAEKNVVIITAGNMTGSVIGGTSSTKDAQLNSVTISGGTIGKNAIGGSSTSGNANNNIISIGGNSQITGQVYGGLSTNKDATGNTVEINGGTINSANSLIAGGVALNGNGQATENTVTIKGNPVFAAETMIYGGLKVSGTGDIVTGNTLNLHTAITVKDVKNFEFYNFYLPSTIQNGQSLLTLTTSETTKLDGSKVVVGLEGSHHTFKAGDVIHLIENAAGGITGTPTSITVQQGITLLYEVSTDMDADDVSLNILNILNVIVDEVKVNPQAKALSEGRIAGLALLNQAGDFLMKQGMSAIQQQSADQQWTPFAAMSGDSSRYQTGSHIDIDGFSLMIGLSHRQDWNTSASTLGGFIEAGWGNYDSYNDFSHTATVNGSGNTKYYGLGLLARHDANNGTYIEGSTRIGQVKTDFASDDLRNNAGQTAHYNSSSTYYAAHLGLGYVWQINKDNDIDIYSKYLWTRQNSDTVDVLGDPIQFEAANSHRLRTGLRFSHQLNAQVTPYLGTAYEYEFDGQAKATTHSYKLDTPSLKGGTGIFELGLQIKPTSNHAWTVNVGVDRYVGQREGFGGQANLGYSF